MVLLMVVVLLIMVTMLNLLISVCSGLLNSSVGGTDDDQK
jgi:hypothetical protein